MPDAHMILCSCKCCSCSAHRSWPNVPAVSQMYLLLLGWLQLLNA